MNANLFSTKHDSWLKGPWLPVLLEEEYGCSELLIRCASTVVWCQGVEFKCLVLDLVSRSWGADTNWDDVRVLPARLEFTTCCETTRVSSRPYSSDLQHRHLGPAGRVHHPPALSELPTLLPCCDPSCYQLSLCSYFGIINFWIGNSLEYPIMNSPHPSDRS